MHAWITTTERHLGAVKVCSACGRYESDAAPECPFPETDDYVEPEYDTVDDWASEQQAAYDDLWIDYRTGG